MTSEELENIVSRHEMQRLELKESFGAECIETACAFTNSQGGFILIGVDNDGNPSRHQLRFEAPYDIRVKVFEDSLRISSPGQLPFDMPMEFLMDPTHPSRPRNKIIAQAFFDMGIIERYGSGIKRIKKECDKNGNPYPEWSDIYGEFATTYRPRVANGGSQQDNEIDGAGHGDKRSDKKSDKKSDKEILEFLKANPSATIEEMQEFSGFSSGGIRKVLYRLKNANLLRRVGPDKGGHWEVVKGGGR
jgi:ATP-dependent DNA helicase RecG